MQTRRVVLMGTVLVAGLAFGARFIPQLLAADPPPNGSSTLAPIVIRDCLVKAVKSARLASDRPGVLAMVEPREGDLVKEGQVVARLRDEVAQANFEVANLVAKDDIEIRYATKLNAVDVAEYEKALGANQQHARTFPDIEIRRLRLTSEKSGLQIDKAKHDVAVNALKAKQSEAELLTYRIVAPFDGVVTQVPKSRGEGVRQGDTILEVVNTDVVQVEGRVNEKDIWNLKIGCPVTVVLNIKGADLDIEKKVFRGKIGFVDSVSDAASSDTRVWAEVPNPGNLLRPGFSATMTIWPGPPTAEAAPVRKTDPRVASRRTSAMPARQAP